jgi:hypothetical protein
MRVWTTLPLSFSQVCSTEVRRTFGLLSGDEELRSKFVSRNEEKLLSFWYPS